jgi:hypothetical protein
MQKLPLWFCLYLAGHIFIPHFLTQTSFYCCQQQSPNIAAEEKNCIAFCVLRASSSTQRRNVIPESLKIGGDGNYQMPHCIAYCFGISVLPSELRPKSQRDKSGFFFLLDFVKFNQAC